MKPTEQLIAELAGQATPMATLPAPGELILKLSAVLILYGLAVLALMGTRSDLEVQLFQPLYATEVVLLLALTMFSLGAAVYQAFPDHYQDHRMDTLALGTFGLFILLLAGQLLLPTNPDQSLHASLSMHSMECTICITAVAALPSLVAVLLLRKGASTQPFSAVAFAVLAATAAGCLILRLSEVNDDPWHLVTWHYLPTFAYALGGGLAGRFLLRW